MRFHLSEEQVAIQDGLKALLQDVVDRQVLDDLQSSDQDFHEPSWRALSGMGVMGMCAPESLGGLGLGIVDAALALEMIGQAAAPGPYLGQIMAINALVASNNSAARERWLDGLLSGEVVATLALSGDWFPNTWTGEFGNGVLNAESQYVQAAQRADLFVVGLRGGGLAVVAANEAVSCSPLPSTDRTRRLSSVRIEKAPAELVIEPGDTAIERWFNAGLVLLAADALGGAQHCLDLSVSYAKQREQFGQVIGQFQALKHQLADMAVQVEPSRSLLWYAAYAYDAQLEDSDHAASIAKAHICDAYVAVARAAIAAHGGIGYTWEYGLNVWFRRSIFNRAVLGSTTAHRARASQRAGW
jgi:alkylation response protein AidB-like acyl-CoA dehydrogenase